MSPPTLKVKDEKLQVNLLYVQFIFSVEINMQYF